MPKTLIPLIRYKVIDECLSSLRKGWTWQDLAAKCGEELRELIRSDLDNPSRRTIMYDISEMRSGKLGYLAPIKYDRNNKTYFYEDANFSIDHSSLDRKDLKELNQALIILKQFSGLKKVDGLENIITKLEHSLNRQRGKVRNVVHFDQATNLGGQEWFDDLYNYLINERCIQLDYQPFHFNQPQRYVISPQLLKEYNRRWFLVAWNHGRNYFQNFALDRIRSIQNSREAYVHHSTFNPDLYFKDIVGVSIPRDGEKVKVILGTNHKQANYIKTKPIHSSQKIMEMNEEEVVFSLEVIINYEFQSLLLSFGENVWVKNPDFLVEEMAFRIDTMRKNYPKF